MRTEFRQSEGATAQWHSQKLRAARRALRTGTLSYRDYRAVEDPIVFDLSRDAACFVSGMSGLGAARTANRSFSIVDKLAPLPCPGVDEFAYVAGSTELVVKAALPCPIGILRFWRGSSREIYPDARELLQDSVRVIKAWTEELRDAGCRNVTVGEFVPERCPVLGLFVTRWMIPTQGVKS